MELEKRIWILWFQGIEQSPQLVKACVNSWITKNPDWDVQILDNSNLGCFLSESDYPLGVDFSILSFAHQADIIRLLLLKKYGGIWADATCYCVAPLSSWDEKFLDGSFFAFLNPGRDRVLSNWFLISKKNGYIVGEWLSKVNSYQKNSKRTRFRFYTIERIINLYPKLWFTHFVASLVKKYPYFWCHYLFGELVRTNSEFKKLFLNCTGLSANNAHFVRQFGFQNRLEIDINDLRELSPVQKLTYKYESDDISSDSILTLFLRGDI